MPSTARERFVALALQQLGKPVCWAHRGPDAFDCSGLVAWCLTPVGGPDLRATHNAQMMFNETPHVTAAEALPGDLGFYGLGPRAVVHVVVYLGNNRVLSADGATSRVTELAAAIANPAARVRQYASFNYRKPFQGLHRNTWLDAVDGVCR